MPLKCIDELPAISGFDFCNPNFVFGEIEYIIISHVSKAGVDVYPGTMAGDESDATLWNPLLLQDPVSGEAVAYLLPVRSSLDEPDQTEVEASANRKAFPPAEWQIEARVDDLSDDVYTALRQLRNTQVRMWFIAGGYIFGGQEGIVPVTAHANPVIEEGYDTLHTMNLKLHWKSADIPLRSVAPNLDDLTIDS